MISLDHADESSKPDKRRAERQAVQGRPAVLLRCLNGAIGKSLTVKLVDFSPHGAGFVFPERPEVGQQYLYSLSQRKGAEVYMLFTVVRTFVTVENDYFVGTELTCLVPAQDLKLGQDTPLQGMDAIRRAILT